MEINMKNNLTEHKCKLGGGEGVKRRSDIGGYFYVEEDNFVSNFVRKSSLPICTNSVTHLPAPNRRS